MTSDPSNIPLQLQIIFIIVSIVLNGITVLSNTAMNTVSRNKIRQMADEDETAAKLQVLLDKPTHYRFTNRFLRYLFITVGLFLSLIHI